VNYLTNARNRSSVALALARMMERGIPSMPSPDLILHGGKIITLDCSSRSAQAMAVRSDRICCDRH